MLTVVATVSVDVSSVGGLEVASAQVRASQSYDSSLCISCACWRKYRAMDNMWVMCLRIVFAIYVNVSGR